VPNFHQHRFGNSVSMKSGHVPCPSKQTWKLTFSAKQTAQFPPKLILKFTLWCNPVFPRFLRTDVAINFHQGHAPVSPRHIRQIKLLRNPVCPIHSNRHGNCPFLKCGHDHFHQNRHAKSIFPRNLVCPIFSKTDLDIHLFCNDAMANCHQR